MLFSFAFCSSVISKPSLKPVSFFLAICYIFSHVQNKQNKNPSKNPNFSFLIFFSCFNFSPSDSWQSQQCQFTSGKNRALLRGHKLQQKLSMDSLALGRSCRKGTPKKDFSRLLSHSPSAVCPSGFALKCDFLVQFIPLPQKATKNSNFHQSCPSFPVFMKWVWGKMCLSPPLKM